MLAGGNHVRLDRAVGAALGLTRALQVHVPEHRLAIARREIDGRPRGDLLLLDDVADAPPAAGPEARHVHLRFVGGQVARAAAQLVGMQEHRRREPRAGRLGEHAGDVVERRDPVEAHVAPAGIDRVADDAGLALGFEAVAHVAAPPRDLAPHQRIAVGANRLGIRRDVESRVVAAHLVVIDVGLRHPLAIHQPPEMLRLGQIQREAVAVVVVARRTSGRATAGSTPRAACRRTSCTSRQSSACRRD